MIWHSNSCFKAIGGKVNMIGLNAEVQDRTMPSDFFGIRYWREKKHVSREDSRWWLSSSWQRLFPPPMSLSQHGWREYSGRRPIREWADSWIGVHILSKCLVWPRGEGSAESQPHKVLLWKWVHRGVRSLKLPGPTCHLSPTEMWGAWGFWWKGFLQ